MIITVEKKSDRQRVRVKVDDRGLLMRPDETWYYQTLFVIERGPAFTSEIEQDIVDRAGVYARVAEDSAHIEEAGLDSTTILYPEDGVPQDDF